MKIADIKKASDLLYLFNELNEYANKLNKTKNYLHAHITPLNISGGDNNTCITHKFKDLRERIIDSVIDNINEEIEIIQKEIEAI